MREFHNIEKIKGNKHYTGYTGAGFARRIEKSTSVSGNWLAWPHIGEGSRAPLLYANSLAQMSEYLGEIT